MMLILVFDGNVIYTFDCHLQIDSNFALENLNKIVVVCMGFMH